MDAYKILGVNRNATDDEIKRAYRKLASQYHPDKGGDTAKFQEIQTAYDTLSDPAKRQQHDNPNPFQNNFDNGFEFHFSNGNPQDIFRQFFSAAGGRNPFNQRAQQPRRNKDLRVQLTVQLSDTLQEHKKTISYQTTKGEQFQIEVTIPRGVSNGTTIKYPHMGDNVIESLTRGDLYVIIIVNNDTSCEVHGINIVTFLEIDCIEAMTGTEKSVRGLANKEYLIKIPPGCQHDTKFRMQAQGLCQMNSSTIGDFIVITKIKVPTLNETQIDILKSLKSAV